MRLRWGALVVMSALAGCGDGRDGAGGPPRTAPPERAPVAEETRPAPGAPACRAVVGAASGTDDFDARTLVGRPLRDAQARAAVKGCAVRVVERDGEGLARTDDLRPERANVVVRDGRVAAIHGVG